MLLGGQWNRVDATSGRRVQGSSFFFLPLGDPPTDTLLSHCFFPFDNLGYPTFSVFVTQPPQPSSIANFRFNLRWCEIVTLYVSPVPFLVTFSSHGCSHGSPLAPLKNFLAFLPHNVLNAVVFFQSRTIVSVPDYMFFSPNFLKKTSYHLLSCDELFDFLFFGIVLYN